MPRTEDHSPNWGGPREGAGRPVSIEGRRQVAFQIPQSQIDWLDASSAERGTNRSDLVRNLIARAMAGRAGPGAPRPPRRRKK